MFQFHEAAAGVWMYNWLCHGLPALTGYILCLGFLCKSAESVSENVRVNFWIVTTTISKPGDAQGPLYQSIFENYLIF